MTNNPYIAEIERRIERQRAIEYGYEHEDVTIAHVTLQCSICGKAFVAKRRDAKYCSANCRKRASRRVENIQRSTRNILSELAYINQQKNHEDPRVIKAIREAMMTITTAIIDVASK